MTVLIGGLEVPGEGQEFEIRNPSRPDEVVATGRACSSQQLGAAVDAAAKAAGPWARTSAAQRGAVLFRVAERMTQSADELARLITREEGKTLADSRIEVARAIDTLRFYGAVGRLSRGETLPSSQPGQTIHTKREPLGVVALITPWNFPLAIPIQKLAPALVQRNSVVLKPSSYTPTIAYRAVQAFREAGLPEGALNLVIGPGAELGGAIARDERVSAISFTGSQKVGAELARATGGRFVRIQLELGGKNPLLVLADADLDVALDIAARGTFGLTGQSCTATGRILVERALYEPFVEGLARKATGLAVGDGLDPDVQIGPKVSLSELDVTTSRLDRGLAMGDAHLVAQGRIPDRAGFFMAPTVLSEVDLVSELGSVELFSPVACVAPVDSFDEGLAKANDTQFGLSAAICTRDLALAHRFVDRVDAGVVKVNAPTTGLELHVPFGGFRGSSSGTAKELGTDSLDFFSRLKSVYLTYDTGLHQ